LLNSSSFHAKHGSAAGLSSKQRLNFLKAMSDSIATYHRPDAEPKHYRCRPGETPGTVDLLNADGEVIVIGVKVIDDPETAGKLPAGYVTVAHSTKKAPSPRRVRKDADDDGEPD
jgi:hypothetical protein